MIKVELNGFDKPLILVPPLGKMIEAGIGVGPLDRGRHMGPKILASNEQVTLGGSKRDVQPRFILSEGSVMPKFSEDNKGWYYDWENLDKVIIAAGCVIYSGYYNLSGLSFYLRIIADSRK